jgi:hypothetical protein
LTVIWERTLRFSPGDTRYIGYCAVFKVREEANPQHEDPGPKSSESPAAGRSLKTQQHAAPVRALKLAVRVARSGRHI